MNAVWGKRGPTPDLGDNEARRERARSSATLLGLVGRKDDKQVEWTTHGVSDQP